MFVERDWFAARNPNIIHLWLVGMVLNCFFSPELIVSRDTTTESTFFCILLSTTYTEATVSKNNHCLPAFKIKPTLNILKQFFRGVGYEAPVVEYHFCWGCIYWIKISRTFPKFVNPKIYHYIFFCHIEGFLTMKGFQEKEGTKNTKKYEVRKNNSKVLRRREGREGRTKDKMNERKKIHDLEDSKIIFFIIHEPNKQKLNWSESRFKWF